jgi:hypothetical protein
VFHGIVAKIDYRCIETDLTLKRLFFAIYRIPAASRLSAVV